jgi:mevalonate kinase
MRIPAKTFFLGEYLALFGGPACLALTHTSFSLDKTKRLHPQSPAQKLWQAKTGQSSNWGLADPYQGKGGLGASGAEFLLAYQQLYPGDVNLAHLHQAYKDYAKTGSGYDVLAQTGNGIVIIENQPLSLQSLNWPFAEIGFVLLHTGKKLKTHEHLSSFQDIAWSRLIPGVEQGCLALLEGDTENFLAAIHKVYQTLLSLNLVATHSQDLLKLCQDRWPILAGKGCGALGADVIALFARRSNIDEIVDNLQSMGLDVLATQADLFFKDAKK